MFLFWLIIKLSKSFTSHHLTDLIFLVGLCLTLMVFKVHILVILALLFNTRVEANHNVFIIFHHSTILCLTVAELLLYGLSRFAS